MPTMVVLLKVRSKHCVCGGFGETYDDKMMVWLLNNKQYPPSPPHPPHPTPPALFAGYVGSSSVAIWWPPINMWTLYWEETNLLEIMWGCTPLYIYTALK